MDRIEIDGTVFELRDWEYKLGRRWCIRLMGVMGAIGSAETMGDRLSNLVHALSEQQIEEFIDTAIKFTMIVGRTDAGGEVVRPLDSEAAVFLRRRHHVTMRLALAHGRREFSDFFGQLGEMLREAFGSQEPAK